METAVRLVDRIRARACELARSGAYADCASIERALDEEGFCNARLALQQPNLRAHIERLCGERRAGAAQEAPVQMAAQELSPRSHPRAPS